MSKSPGVLVYAGTKTLMSDSMENIGTYKHETYVKQLSVYIILAITSVGSIGKVCYVLGERSTGWISWAHLFTFGVYSDKSSQ